MFLSCLLFFSSFFAVLCRNVIALLWVGFIGYSCYSSQPADITISNASALGKERSAYDVIKNYTINFQGTTDNF
ncbi:hypothetical protein Hanom_Chr06g00517881 [Helianthus anomalus]